MLTDFVRPREDDALPLELAVKLTDKIIDFEVEQIARQIRAACRLEDRQQLARYYYAHLVDRLAQRLGADFGLSGA